MKIDFVKALNWRYATKEYDKTKKVSEKDFEEILEIIRLAPSSFGIQPWKFIVIKDMNLREEIRKAAWGQSPVTDASHLIVFAAKNNLTAKDVDTYLHSISEIRGVPLSSLDGLKQYITSAIHGKSVEYLKGWNQRQLYIPFGMALEAAALKGIDATPMEGFDPIAVDKILGLEKEGFASTIMLALGYRSANDKHVHYKKVRYAKDKVFSFR